MPRRAAALNRTLHTTVRRLRLSVQPELQSNTHMPWLGTPFQTPHLLMKTFKSISILSSVYSLTPLSKLEF